MFETDRLIIRKFRPEDANGLYDYLSLPQIYIFEPGDPITKEQAAQIADERSNANAFYAVELKSIKVMVGHLYFEQLEPKEFMTWELGYIFNPKFQNKGYCTEASKGLLEYGFRELHAHRITAFCNPLNDPSWHVLEKTGMKREGYFKQKAFFRRDEDNNPIWHDCFAYGIIAEDYFRK
jgi:[ribosomal protein S5]-alanine N-acetyltransferase